MTCPFCGAKLVRVEHLPTDECGTYWFVCGTDLHDGRYDQSRTCREMFSVLSPGWREATVW